MSSGKFFHDGDTYKVVGAPRVNYFGKVIIFNCFIFLNPNHIKKPIVSHPKKYSMPIHKFNLICKRVKWRILVSQVYIYTGNFEILTELIGDQVIFCNLFLIVGCHDTIDGV